ncbi:hypothetical protein SAMN02745146_1938 [Hymenobacter daecheongensis DSM 21074]|uniref:Oxygen tolerance n=1 Tax=Hymenobacter daecheongensis DSM 21074 TaxID=1121955 RepID=A0A1M6F511_9BACT|nr:hypothetical protein [Hymenobacter daecheongensis]SHI92761.1 hypothetical protein SAMN02745146_1938 [Hymenobacter daecheongensis DSM 21074]
MRKRGLLLAVLLLTGVAQAQVPATELTSRFRRSTTRVGQPIDYELSYRHAPAQEVIFPDSTADFAPFEFVGKTYVPTRTRHGRSLDRTVYHLRTFALDSVQRLRLSITVLQGRDTLLLPAPEATVRLLRTAPTPEGPEPPALRQNTALVPVQPEFNWPYWVAGAGLLGLLGLALVVGFGSRLRRRYQRYKLRKNHAYFLAQYARHVERFTLSRSLANMERAITLWKNYLSVLENNIINSLTTKEVVAHFQNDADVSMALQIADKVIYGNQLSEEEAETDLAFVLLRNFAERRYALVAEQPVE